MVINEILGRYLQIEGKNIVKAYQNDIIEVTFYRFNSTSYTERYYLLNCRHVFFNNIIIEDGIKEIEINTMIPIKNLFVYQTEDRYYTNAQKVYNEKLKIQKEKSSIESTEREIYYSISGNINKPKRLIVTFPGFAAPHKEVSYLIIKYSTLEKQLNPEDFLLVAFQDNYLSSGSYMLMDDNGNDLTKAVINKISSLLVELHLTDSDLLMFGASKGASTAAYYGTFFRDAKMILCVPQMNLSMYNVYRPDNVWNMVQRINDSELEFDLNYFNIIHGFQREDRDVNLFLSSKDSSNVEEINGLISTDRFKIHCSDDAHGNVTKNNTENIIKEIKEWVNQ